MPSVLLVLTLAGCTLGLPLTTAAVEGIHNAEVDHAADKWSYAVPLLVSGAVGALLDYFLAKGLQAQWSKPWS